MTLVEILRTVHDRSAPPSRRNEAIRALKPHVERIVRRTVDFDDIVEEVLARCSLNTSSPFAGEHEGQARNWLKRVVWTCASDTCKPLFGEHTGKTKGRRKGAHPSDGLDRDAALPPSEPTIDLRDLEQWHADGPADEDAGPGEVEAYDAPQDNGVWGGIPGASADPDRHGAPADEGILRSLQRTWQRVADRLREGGNDQTRVQCYLDAFVNEASIEEQMEKYAAPMDPSEIPSEDTLRRARNRVYQYRHRGRDEICTALLALVDEQKVDPDDAVECAAWLGICDLKKRK